MKYLYVIIGGGLGALLRYISTEIITKINCINFPFGTLFVNIFGSFLIGLFYKLFENDIIPQEYRILIITGFLGGYTTFSTYSMETAQNIINGNINIGIINLLANNILCILFVVLGLILGKIIIK
jgi:CrcB protein